jgi:hypothetical protein
MRLPEKKEANGYSAQCLLVDEVEHSYAKLIVQRYSSGVSSKTCTLK